MSRGDEIALVVDLAAPPHRLGQSAKRRLSPGGPHQRQQRWRLAAHALRGSSATLGARDLEARLQALETAMKSDTDVSDQWLDAALALNADVQKLSNDIAIALEKL